MQRRYLITVDGTQFEIDLISRTDNGLEFSLLGETHRVTISAPIIAPMNGARTVTMPDHHPALPTPINNQSTPHQVGTIVAPMPGIVAKVLVNLGDTIVTGQPLLVIEAMKMENAIVSTRSGAVKSLTISAGSEVKKNQVLMVIE